MRETTVLFILFISMSAFGHANNDTLIDLDGLLAEAIANNPELSALMADYRAAGMRISALRYLADPMVSIEWQGGNRMYGISQRLPFPTKIAAQAKVEAMTAEQDYLKYANRLNSMILDVKTAYAQLYLSHRTADAAEKAVSFLKQVYDVTLSKYALGEASQSEVLRAQIELSKVENDRAAAKDDISLSEAALNVLLHRHVDEPLGIPQEPMTLIGERDLVELYAHADELEPMLKAYGVAYKKAAVMKSLAHQTYLPDFMLGFSQTDGVMNDRKYMLGFTIPLWFMGKQRNLVREAEFGRQMALANYEAVRNDVMLSVKRAKLQVDKKKRLVVLYRNSLLPQTEAALKSALAEYGVGGVEFEHLLDTATLLVRIELEYHQANADYFTAAAELERAIGIVD
ncbi:MAG: TolC family protein [candidate division WOR-3 bacterium]|nr:MAG: TolC family protein [candidate division WOR-3 bacterium]